MSDDENRGYGSRRSAPVPTSSISPMEEVERKREPKASYRIPKKSSSSMSSSSSRDAGSSGYSRDRDKNSYKRDDRSRDRGRDKTYNRRDSLEDTRSPLSRRDSSSSGGFNKKHGGHLEEELSVANDTSWKDLIDDNAPPPDLTWKKVERVGESGLPDFNGGFKDSREFRKTLPRHELTEEEKEEKRQNQPSPVRMDYSITKVIRHLKMNDRQSELDDIKRERRDSDNSAVVLVERHIDDDLIGHVEPDPDDINFQEARLREGELTKEEKKRWKRRYRGEAVFMLPSGHAERLKRNFANPPPREKGGDRRTDSFHESLRREHPNANTMEIKPRFGPGAPGRGLSKGQPGGDTINRLQQMAGGGRSPPIKKERQRSRSPNDRRRSGHSSSSMRRSRSRERNERRRSRERSPPLPSERRSSDDYTPLPPPPPPRSQYRASRSRSRSPQMREGNGSDRYDQSLAKSGYNRPRSPKSPDYTEDRDSHASLSEIKQEPMRLEQSPTHRSNDHHRSPNSISPSPPVQEAVPYSSRDRDDDSSVRSCSSSPEPLRSYKERRERPRSPSRQTFSDSKNDRYRRERH